MSTTPPPQPPCQRSADILLSHRPWQELGTGLDCVLIHHLLIFSHCSWLDIGASGRTRPKMPAPQRWSQGSLQVQPGLRGAARSYRVQQGLQEARSQVEDPTCQCIFSTSFRGWCLFKEILILDMTACVRVEESQRNHRTSQLEKTLKADNQNIIYTDEPREDA